LPPPNTNTRRKTYFINPLPPHTPLSHLYGFSPVCMRLCTEIFSCQELSQTSHLYGFSASYMLMKETQCIKRTRWLISVEAQFSTQAILWKKIKVYMKIPNAPENNAGQVDSHNHTNNTKTQRCQHKPWDKTQTNFTVTITARDIRANFYGS